MNKSEALRSAYEESLPDEDGILLENGHIRICERIEGPEIQIGRISEKVQPKKLILEEKDRKPIKVEDRSGRTYTLTHPGKSAFIYLGPNPVGVYLTEAVWLSFKRPPMKRDNIHLTTVGAIESAGWQAFWTPLNRDLLHVRLVAVSTIERGLNPTLAEAKALSNTFSKAA